METSTPCFHPPATQLLHKVLTHYRFPYIREHQVAKLGTYLGKGQAVNKPASGSNLKEPGKSCVFPPTQVPSSQVMEEHEQKFEGIVGAFKRSQSFRHARLGKEGLMLVPERCRIGFWCMVYSLHQ